MTLRTYQEQFINNIAKKLSEGNRSILGQLPTGGGKTISFSAISKRFIERNPDKSVMILVHRKELLQQTRRTLYNAYQIMAQPIIAGMRIIPKAPVYVGMVESAFKRKDRIYNIGLIIIDEAHIASFAKIHDAYPDTMIIGVTATPISANKKKPLKLYYQDIVCSIDIPELIAMGSLCQNITVAPRDVVQRASLTIKNGEFDEGMMALQFSKPKYIQNTLDAYNKYAPGTKAIIFNITVHHSKLVCNAFLDAGFPAKHIDGETSSLERHAALKWFSDTPNGILCNVGIATTGFDEPSIETVIVNKATMSMPLWLQMTGRGSRPTPSKVIFNIIDMGANAITHGDWSQARDWETMFWKPPKAGDGGGVAPIKVCPQCDNIIAAQCQTCPNCGYQYPSKEETMEEQLGDFVIVTRGINPMELIEQNKEKKEYYPFFAIGKQLADQAKNTIPVMTDDNAYFILDKYHSLASEWCHIKGKKYNKWHKDKAKETLFSELAANFKKWKNPIVKPFDPLTLIPNLKNMVSL